jgi:hypothetical protein
VPADGGFFVTQEDQTDIPAREPNNAAKSSIKDDPAGNRHDADSTVSDAAAVIVNAHSLAL